jgi:RNA 2',3'-cyclic 3'-phosphodiesterase
MRLFIAIDLPDNAKDYLYGLQRAFNKDNSKVTWVHKKNLHLTLKFLGEVDASRLDELEELLRKIKFKEFSAALDGFGAFPSLESPNVLWVGLKPEHEIIKLARFVDEETLLFSKSDVQFKTHLTIGRVKMIKFKKEFAEQLKKIKIEKIKFKINSFTLYKSTLTNQGAVYEKLEEYKS